MATRGAREERRRTSAHRPKERPSEAAALGDEELIGAMRRREPDAFHEFFARFAPMLDVLAGVRRVPLGERESTVTEFLDDAAMRLVPHTAPVPRALAAYLAVSFRRWHLNRVRDRRRREELDIAHAAEMNGHGEQVILGASSEDAVRISHGPAYEPEPPSPLLQHLVLMLENGLGASDRQLLEWLAQRVPQREIADWLGVSHGAIRVRVSRLRQRLRDAVDIHAATLDEDGRRELDRILGRRGSALMPNNATSIHGCADPAKVHLAPPNDMARSAAQECHDETR